MGNVRYHGKEHSRPMSWKLSRLLAGCMCMLFALSGAISTPAAAQSNTALVIDHSADMGLKIGDDTKISIVQNTLASLLEEYESSMKLGGDCHLTRGGEEKRVCITCSNLLVGAGWKLTERTESFDSPQKITEMQ